MSESATKNTPPFRESGCRGQDIIQDDDVHVVDEDGEKVNDNHFTVVEDELEENPSDPEGPAKNGKGCNATHLLGCIYLTPRWICLYLLIFVIPSLYFFLFPASTASPHYKNGHANKRRKGDFAYSTVSGLGSIMLQISNQQIQSYDRQQSDMRAREVALENRERAIVEREQALLEREQALLKQEREFVIDMMKKSEEARERRMQEHEK
jgi:hypothetical protein